MSEENILLSRSRYDSIMERLAQFEEERKKKSQHDSESSMIEGQSNASESVQEGVERQIPGERVEETDEDKDESFGREREDIYMDNQDLLPPRGYVINDDTTPKMRDYQTKKGQTVTASTSSLSRASPESGLQRKKKPLKKKRTRTIQRWIPLL